MARETKVGLLAGLAFIICFAVILANRGRQEPPAPPRSYLTDGGANVPGSVQQTASRMSSNPADSERRSATGRPVQATPTLPDAGLSRPDRPASNLPSASRADLLLPEPPTGHVASAPRTPVGGADTGLSQPGDRILTSRSEDDLAARQELERRLGLPGSGSAATGAPDSHTPHGASTPQPGPQPMDGSSPRQGSAAKVVPYTVAPGDTLSKIALVHFGNKARTSVNAIFDSNRAILSSPDELKAGWVLSLPVLEGTPKPVKSEPPAVKAAKSSRTEEVKNQPTKKSAEPPAPTYRWYQVKKNDRYASIAREQLGDTGRWRELHEMNKDKFPDPQLIREGVRIKVPTTKVLASAEGRR